MKLRLNGFGGEQSTTVPFDDPNSPLYTPADGSLPTSYNPKAGSATLKPGMKGELVRDLQASLLYLGYKPGAVDGIYGAGTHAAVLSFQRAVGLVADGIVGPNTWQALRAAYAAKKAAASTDSTPSGGTGSTPSGSSPTGTPPLLSRDEPTCNPGDYYCAGVTSPWIDPWTAPENIPAWMQPMQKPEPDSDISLPVALVGAALGGVLGYAYTGKPLGGAVGLGAGGLGAWAILSLFKAF